MSKTNQLFFYIFRNNQSEISNDEILSCPPEFILFNNICYYIHLSFIYNIQHGERLCYNQYWNSTLVKFNSHDWGNINSTRFLGRTFEDILIELFYYLLEKKLSNQIINESNKKHWLRLLIGDKNDPNECVLRYFERISGAFTTFYRCNNGGHPVCQCEPIRTKIPFISKAILNNNYSSPRIIESTTPRIILNSTDLSSTIIPICENCTENLLADEELVNNETKIDSDSFNDTIIEITNEKKKFLIYRPLLLILTGPVLGLIILFIGIGLLIRHLRQNHGSYSTRSSIVGSHRTKRSSTIITTGDIPNTPTILYTRLKAPRISSTETDMLLPLDNSLSPNDDSIEMLPASKIQIINADEDKRKGDDEELLYATLK